MLYDIFKKHLKKLIKSGSREEFVMDNLGFTAVGDELENIQMMN